MSGLDFQMVQHTDFRMNFTVYDSDSALVDLTDAVITFKVMLKKGATPVISKTSTASGNQITILNQVTNKGEFHVDLLPTDSTTLLGKYIHDESIVDGDGKASNLRNSDGTFGTILFTPQFTSQA